MKKLLHMSGLLILCQRHGKKPARRDKDDYSKVDILFAKLLIK
ncbi:hypothetical protein Noda2021_00200 [Candidatus Dependentiae bacterium Noda2021]|nr:hypothetical protein Noda2021_00200 [Candidatus Dependentiae bacterium Noda2021]